MKVYEIDLSSLPLARRLEVYKKVNGFSFSTLECFKGTELVGIVVNWNFPEDFKSLGLVPLECPIVETFS